MYSSRRLQEPLHQPAATTTLWPLHWAESSASASISSHHKNLSLNALGFCGFSAVWLKIICSSVSLQLQVLHQTFRLRPSLRIKKKKKEGPPIFFGDGTFPVAIHKLEQIRGPDLQLWPEHEALTKILGTCVSVKKERVKEHATSLAFPILL